MKKKILGGFAVLAVAVAVAFNVNMNNSEKNSLSDLVLANVEALADTEDDSDYDNKWTESKDETESYHDDKLYKESVIVNCNILLMR